MTRFKRLDDRPDPPVDLNALSWVAVPASPTASGTAGDVARDASWFYVCTATNVWRRTALASWGALPTIAGLQLHLDASDSSTLYDDTSGGSLVAADGGVARWEDKSGNGRHATQATSGRRPISKAAVQNGKAVLRFDGIDDFLDGSTTPSTGNTRTCFLVSKASAQDGGEVVQIGKWTSTSTRAFLLRQRYGGGNTMIGGDLVATNLNVASIQLPFTSFHLSTWRQVSDTRYVSYWHNRQSQTVTETVQSFNADSGYFIGKGESSGVSFGFHGLDIAEILIYDSALSDTDLAAVEAYLMNKWAIA